MERTAIRSKPQTHGDRIGESLARELRIITRDINRLLPVEQEAKKVLTSGRRIRWGRFAELVFNGPVFAAETLEASRGLGEALDRGKGLKRLIIAPELLYHDGFREKAAGRNRFYWAVLSPRQLGNLPMPLNNEGIGQIDRFMKSFAFPPFQYGDPRITNLTVIMAIQQLARPDLKLSIPRGLSSLNDRLLAYFDYYMGFITIPDTDSDEGLRGYGRMIWAGARLLIAISSYIPARLGITPSSVRKLFLEKSYIIQDGFLGNRFQQTVASEIDNAYRRGALPAHLEGYQHFDKEVDKRAAEALAQQFRWQYRNWGQDQESPEQTLSRLARYRADLRAEALRSKDKAIRINIDSEGPIRDILVASQNRQTLMLIVTMGDGSFVTLEANNSSRLFGIPPTLKREFPHIEALMVRNIVGSVLDYAQTRFPKIEPRTIKTSTVSSPKLPDDEVFKKDLGASEKQVVIKPPKRKTLRSTIAHAMSREPEVPQPAQEKERIRTVLATRSDIVDLMPKNTPDKVIDAAMKAITAFEYGDKNAKSLTDYDGESIRFGKHRLLVVEQRPGLFIPARARHRKDVYRDFKARQ